MRPVLGEYMGPEWGKEECRWSWVAVGGMADGGEESRMSSSSTLVMSSSKEAGLEAEEACDGPGRLL